MARWKLWFVLLLPLPFYIDSKATLVKTIGSKPDVTPLCTNETQSIILLIVCRIRTERNWGEECRLLYRQEQDFVRECDSRFTLMTENQTVFLHLTSLTPVDSGNYTCECSYHGGTYILQLNITVEEDEDGHSAEEMSFVNVVIGAFIFIIITGIILGFIYRKIHHRRQSVPLTSRPDTEPYIIEPYSTFIQRENELYSAAATHSYTNTANSNVFTHI